MLNIYNYVTETGTITVDAGEAQIYVQNLFKAIFGNNLDVDPSTPQGMYIQAFTLMLKGLAENNASIANQINRNISGGIFLDADAQLFAIQRIPGTPSSVYATISGSPGTVIAANSQASETVNGLLFATVNPVTIPASGTIENVLFQSWSNVTNPPGFINGPIPCEAGTLTQIVSTIVGWESVTNPDPATLGTLQQSDVNFRNTINRSLGAQSVGSMAAIYAALYTTPGVNSAYGLQNVTSITQTIQGVSMAPHSIYFCIDYTCSDSTIASSLENSKDLGCDYNNGPGINHSYNYIAPISSQDITVLWDSPSIVSVQIRVTINASTSLQDPDTSITNAVLAYAAGEVDLMPGFTVGTSVSPNQISAAITQQIPGLFIDSVEVSTASFTAQGTLTTSSNIITNIPSTSGITNGMQITGTGIPGGTTVTNASLSSTSIQISNNATASQVSILTFATPIVYQTTPIAISAWQKAATVASYITVVET